jgi:succinate-semialdehyde dehydrogenase/glutarate-semialdehyde dehydrogenase
VNEQDVLAKVPRGLFIGGEWRDASDGGTLEVEDPATGKALTTVASATVADGAAALDAAVAAQADWAATAPRERAELLRSAFELITERADELALLMTLEMGKPLAQSKGEVTYGAEFFRWFSEEVVRIAGRWSTSPDGSTRLLTMKQPVGPTLMITPWNFPLAMGTRKIGPAIAAGCTMVVKPAQQTPLTMLALAGLLEEVGVPRGVVNVVTTSSTGEVMGPIIGDSRLRKLTFTGSTGIGKELVKQSADQLLRVSMELGGNAPFLVFADANLDAAVDGAMLAKMRNMGEACTAANRFLVHEDVADEFASRFAERMAAETVGRGTEDGVTVGPLIDAKARDKVTELVHRGGRLLLRPDGPHRRPRGRRGAARGGVRAGRARDHVLRRREGGGAGQRHRVRPGRLRLHHRPRPDRPGRRGAAVRDGRHQPGHRVQPGGALRRGEAVRLRPRGGTRGDRGVPEREVRRHRPLTP